MYRLLFVVPAHGRHEMTRVCLRQLRRTCDALLPHILASAIVVACDENLDTARDLGFGTLERDNEFLSRRFNDGIQLACDPRHNPRVADFVVPMGSDDWLDHRALETLPGPDSVLCFQEASFVDESGTRLVTRHIDYEGGVGVRVYPRAMLHRLDYRPADEDRARGCDTSILVNLKRTYARSMNRHLRIVHAAHRPHQVVDWKSAGQQLNSYDEIANRFNGPRGVDPFEALHGIYPAEAITEMKAHYRGGAW